MGDVLGLVRNDRANERSQRPCRDGRASPIPNGETIRDRTTEASLKLVPRPSHSMTRTQRTSFHRFFLPHQTATCPRPTRFSPPSAESFLSALVAAADNSKGDRFPRKTIGPTVESSSRHVITSDKWSVSVASRRVAP